VAQDFVAGAPASVSFSALRGRVLAAFAYKAIHRHPGPLGVSSVIETIDDPGLLTIAHRVAAHLDYTGFGGVDVILPGDGGAPVFLELNARPTHTTHLGRLLGADLCEALADALDGRPGTLGRLPAAGQTVALFPTEWERDPASPYLFGPHHDVPWHEHRILASLMIDHARSVLPA